MSTGLLQEHGTPFTRLSAFNGDPDSTTISTPLRCRLVQATLLSATVNANAQVDTAALPAESGSDTFDYQILLYAYHKLKPDAVSQNLISITNNQLVDISGPQDSPYKREFAIAAAPWRKKALTAGQVYAFSPTVATNIPAQFVTGYEINTGQGFTAVAPGSVYTFTASSGSEMDFEARVTLTNGKVLLSRSKMTVTPNASASPTIDPVGYCGGEEPEFTIDLSSATPAWDDEIDRLFVQTSCCDGVIRRPLLIIGGFETPTLFDPDIEDNQENGHPFFIDNDFDFIIERLTVAPTPTGNPIIQDLLNDGYDLIFLDFDDETKPLEQNAQVVKQAIREINDRKVTDEPLVIAGLSMGGVVGKLALLEMERDGETHDARLFVSVDSPLRGANIPLGLQHMVHHLNGLKVHVVPGVASISLGTLVPDLSGAAFTLKRPSVRQLLTYHSEEDLLFNNSYRSFYDYFTSLGKLQQCEHLAIAAGSQIGIGQGFNPHDKLVSLAGTSGQLLTQFSNLGSGWSLPIDIASNLFLGTGGYLDFDVWSLPDMPSSPKFIYRNVTVVRVFTIPVVFDIVKVRVSGTQPFDSAPAGRSALVDDEGGALPGLLQPNFGFIPTISALEVGPYQSLAGPLSDPFQPINDNNAVLALSQTTMDYMVANDDPDIENANGEHDNPFSVDNTGMLLSVASNGAVTPATLDNRTFNHGDSPEVYDYANPPMPFPVYRTEPIIDEDTDIINGGQLWVNRAGRIGFTDIAANLNNDEVSDFEVFIRSSFCEGDPTTLTIAPTARMELGQWDAAAGITNTAQVYVQADATVSIQAQGELYINKDSRFIVQEGGYTEVLSDGLLSAGFGGQVRIEKGGEARIGSGGILRVSQDSKCVVEDGGKLVLEPGAIVQLWDGDDPFGRAVLEVQGELEVQGSIDFSGNGFFDFFQSHILSLTGGIFRIEGRGIGKRFLRLRNNTTLDIGDNTVELLEGLAEYGNYAKISVGQGEAFISNMELKTGGQTAVGLLADGATKIRFVDNEAYGFANAVEAYHTYPANALDFLFFQSGFSDNRNSIWLSYGSNARVWDCHFNGTGTGVNAMLLDKLQSVRVDASVIENYNVPTEPEYMTWGAVHVSNVGEYIMSGGELSNNDVGLYCPPGKYVNVTLRGQAEVADNDFYGLHIVEGNREGSNYGLVTMDCARLLNNGLAGIKGSPPPSPTRHRTKWR
ncbi:hypothetical protein [Phaeodactylibacter xiamenensis]|uniref:DUF676 domain-containing protein n=1 Tax=Phaeodactylibacter xiamenensis TaxID=1524460 RepID=A0A098S566_9BACT|nr:hypothetical protein [Phaeodactylibacter xiamenensis]KGE87270.1 hypothetical protein IX84_16650 [Phaeodactylibacter xiamenensis]